MEVSLLTESANNIIENPILDSNSNRLPITWRDGELVLADQQESDNKCNHFTIRDYVSDVRKKNAEICLPFPMLGQSSIDHVNALPPLQVKRFRRWDCQRCARVIVAPRTIIPNGANMTSESNHGSKNHDTLRVGDSSTKEEAKSFARSPQQNESSVLVKKGTGRSNVCYHRSEDDQNRTSKPNTEARQTREKEEAIIVRASSSRTALPSEDNPKILSSRWGNTVLVHLNEISDKEEDQRLSKTGKRKELRGLINPKNGAVPSSPDHISHHYSKNLDECSDEESDTSIHFVDARKPGVPVVKPHPRKARKVRAITDIMKSAASRKVNKNCSSSENIGAGVRGSTQIPESSKDNDEHPKDRGYQIQDEEPMSIKRKEAEAVSNDGDGTCLIHWLKKVPKKSRLHNGEFEAQDHVNNAASTSKCTSLKGLDVNLECSPQGEKKKEIIDEKKRNMRPEVVKSSFKLQQKARTATGDLQAKNLHSRSPEIIIPEKDFRPNMTTIENNYKKSLLGNKKNKRPLVEDGESSQPRCFKDSLGIQEQAFTQTREVIKRKQRTMGTSEREGVDDIPMDIVEHLAKKQHEKYLMNTKEDSSNLSKLPVSIENVKNLNACNNGGYEAQFSMINNEDTESRSKSKKYHLHDGYDARISTINNRDTENRSKSRPYPLFDLNQEAPTCVSTESQLPSQYIGLSMTGDQLTIIDSNRNYFPQNLSAVGMKTLPFCSDHTNPTVSPQNLFGSAYYDGESFGSLSGYPSRVNAQNITSSFVYPSPEAGNGYYSNVMVPGDQHFNETMSASNFLRIVNQSAHSGDPCLSLLRNGYINTSNSRCSEFPQSEIDYNNGGKMCKLLRPLPRIGILGPLLQKEITNASNNNIRPTLGFGANSQTSFMASYLKPSTSHMTIEKVMNAQTSVLPSESWKRMDNNGQVLTDSRNGAFQPLKSAYKMEECVVNRNPADLAMVDEDSDYMIGYKEDIAKPHSGKSLSQTHFRGHKGQKMKKLSEIKQSRKRYKASSRDEV